MREVKSWANEGDAETDEAAQADARPSAERDEEWVEIGRLVEKKIKRKVRKWAEED